MNAPVSPDLSACFADDYFTAREQFLSRAADVGCRVDSHLMAAVGPRGEPLFIDVAVREAVGTPNDAWQTVVVSSGLHGVEGFLGSAVQCAALDWLARTPMTRVPRLLFVHALNPYGFAWIRRCNEDNVDLNRNFPIAGNEYRGAPDGYVRLNRLLNKPTPPSPCEPFRLAALVAILRFGLAELRRAIAGGQYEYPQGLFYGGTGPCETTRFLMDHFSRWLDDSPAPVLHLDYHTGLGRRGDFQLLSDVPPSSQQGERVSRVLQRPLTTGRQSASVSYAARGSICEWCLHEARERDYTYACVEFGTDLPVKVLMALRAENRAHHWDRPDSKTTRWARQLLKDAFCPRDPVWRAAALGRGLELIQRAVAGDCLR